MFWNMVMMAESRFRRLKGPELMKDVQQGAIYKDGIIIESASKKVAA